MAGKNKRRTIGRPRKKKIPPKPLVLIVCEGEKTEPEYFEQLRKSKRFQRERIVVLSPKECGGTDPTTLVCSAKDWKKKMWRDDRLDYEEVWCVFDRDQHINFDAAVDQAYANGFEVAFSVPCFELWYLLHLQKQTAHIERGKVREKLKKASGLEDYDKEGLYDKLKDKQQKALDNAAALRDYHKRHGHKETENPATRVDELVTFLENMK